MVNVPAKNPVWTALDDFRTTAGHLLIQIKVQPRKWREMTELQVELRKAPTSFQPEARCTRNREIDMRKFNLLGVAIALSVAMPMTLADTAFAAKKAPKLTYEQAWARCKKLIDDTTRYAGIDQMRERSQRGAACMHKLGHRI
jgi:hypothetical protein